MNEAAWPSTRDLVFHRFVLIYQMPKIGSQTIESTLNHFSFPDRILRFHYLSPVFANTLRHGLSSSQPDAAWRRNAQLQLDAIRHISRAFRWRGALCRCGFPIPKLQIITGVRELIGLVLASIFENFAYFAPDIESMSAGKCREALLHPKTFKTLPDWFDQELKSFAFIDVFRKEFPFDQGYTTYESKFARLLLYRFESLNEIPARLSEFLEWKIPSLINSNLGESKQYAERYREVKEGLRLPPEFVTTLYDTKMMRHFYSEQERQQFYLKWAEPGPAAR